MTRTRSSGLAALAFVGTITIRPIDAQHVSAAHRLTGTLSPCRVDGLNEPVLCGRYEVFENRELNAGRMISLNVVVLPATTDSVANDPLVFLAGGGVVPATRYAPMLARSMPSLRRHRDILLIDQRGTGGSHALTCDRAALDTAVGLPPDQRFLRYVGACRASLSEWADVRMYTTPMAMDDLDDVRRWLGYGSLNLYGASYGTSAAATYVRRYPSLARTVVMHGVVPLDVPMQLDLAASAQRALDAVIALCERDRACRDAYPSLRADLDAVLAGSAPSAQSTGGSPNAGQPFREVLNASLASVDGIRRIPMLIRDARRGELPSGASPAGPAPAPLGVRLAILCSEGLSSVDTAAIASRTAGTFLGDFPVRFQLQWCNGWPIGRVPTDFRSPFKSNVPALLMTGELDPITPPSYADHVARSFSRHAVLRLPGRSHADTDACTLGLIEAFVLSGGGVPDASCLADTPPLRFTER